MIIDTETEQIEVSEQTYLLLAAEATRRGVSVQELVEEVVLPVLEQPS